MRRVVLVTNIPTPYRIPLFNELAGQLGEAGMSLKVVFAALGYRRRLWSLDMEDCAFDYAVLPSRTYEVGGDAERTMFSYSGLVRELRASQPDVVLITGFSLGTVKLWLYAKARRVPYVIWSGSWGGGAASGQAGRSLRSWLRTLQRRALVRGASACVAYGTKAKEYLVGLGAPPETVHVGINTVDTRFFRERAEAERRNAGGAGKARLLCVSYLIPRKGIVDMLRAVGRVAEDRDDFVLDVVGDGDDRAALEAHVERDGLDRHVTFHGYRQRGEVPAFLARSRCLLFPTERDVWGLVLVEAMAAGVPAIASVQAGATHDLVEDGRTGFAVDFADEAAVADRIRWVLDHPDGAAAMGEQAGRLVAERVTLAQSAAGFVGAVRHALGEAAPGGRGGGLQIDDGKAVGGRVRSHSTAGAA